MPMIILALETSTSRASLAVLEHDTLLFHEEIPGDRSLGAHLFPALQRALAAAPHIDQIVVGLGPGSHSGIRIAIAAAIGLRLARNAALIGIPSVAAHPASEYIALGDARRGTWHYTHVREGQCLEGPQLLTPEEAGKKLDQKFPVFSSTPLPGAQLSHPTADRLAHLAQQNISIIATETLEPLYLRDPHITLPKLTTLRTGGHPAPPAHTADC